MKARCKHNFNPISLSILNEYYQCVKCNKRVKEDEVKYHQGVTYNRKYSLIQFRNVDEQTLNMFNELKEKLKMNKKDIFEYLIKVEYKKQVRKKWRF